MNYRIVRVNWIDATEITTGWITLETIQATIKSIVTSVGHLIEEYDDYIIIALSIGQYGIQGAMTIPTRAILDIEDLQPSEIPKTLPIRSPTLEVLSVK